MSAGLDAVALGEATPGEARAAVAAALASGDTASHARAYVALRAFTWKALDGRRRDDGLRDWHDIVRGAAAYLRPRDPSAAARLDVLAELLFESLMVAATLPTAEAMERRVVAETVALLAQAPDGRLGREALGDALGLEGANLARLLSMMSAAGLVERAPPGGDTDYRLTATGIEAASLRGHADLNAPAKSAHPGADAP